MPIISKWQNNEKTIIYMQFIHDWTWDEIPQIRATVIEMLNSVSHTVDYIADFRGIDYIPIGALIVGRNIRNTRLANEGVALIVGTSPILRMLFQSFSAAYPGTRNELFLVSTLDEAHQKLADIQQNRHND